MKNDDKKPGGPERDDRDVNVGSVVRLGLLLAVITGLALWVTSALIGSLRKDEKAGHTEPPPIAAARPTAPPEPRLSPSPPKKLEAQRADEEVILDSYGWEDAERGVVRIPISSAIDLLAERGLPSRAPREAPSAISRPTQSSLGEPRPASEAPAASPPPAPQHGGHE